MGTDHSQILQNTLKMRGIRISPFLPMDPILAFTILMNPSPILISATSRAFAFIGKSVIRSHFWLVVDTKGTLLVVSGTRCESMEIDVITVMFIYLSDRVTHAATQITNYICGDSSSPARALPLPLPVTVMTASAPIPDECNADNQASMHNLKDDAVNPFFEPEILWKLRLSSFPGLCQA